MNKLFFLISMVISFSFLSCEQRERPAVKKVVKKTQSEIEEDRKLAIVRKERAIVESTIEEMEEEERRMRPTFLNMKREDLQDKSSYDQTRIQFSCTVHRCLGPDKVKYKYPFGRTVTEHSIELYSIKKDGTDLRKVLDQDELFQFGWLIRSEPIPRSNNGRYITFRVAQPHKAPKNKIKGIRPYFQEIKSRLGKHYDKKKSDVENIKDLRSLIRKHDYEMGVLYDIKLKKFYDLGVVRHFFGRSGIRFSAFSFSNDSELLLFNTNIKFDKKHLPVRICSAEGQSYKIINPRSKKLVKKLQDKCHEKNNLKSYGHVFSNNNKNVRLIIGDNTDNKNEGIRDVSIKDLKLIKERKIIPEKHAITYGYSKDRRFVVIDQTGGGCFQSSMLNSYKCEKILDTKTLKTYPINSLYTVTAIETPTKGSDESYVYFLSGSTIHRMHIPTMNWERILEGGHFFGPQLYNEEALNAN